MRRYRTLLVENDAILAILRGEVTVASFDVPDDARVVSVAYHPTRMGFMLTIESAQFEHVPFGVELPLLPPYTCVPSKPQQMR